MNRRQFSKSSLAFAASLTNVSFVVGLTGCDTTTVAEFVSVIAQDAAALATFFGSTSIATQITALSGQLAADIKNWQAGGPASDAIQAINDLITLVSLIPIATQYAPLIVLILSALTGLLALLPASATQPKAKAAMAKYHAVPYPCKGFDKHSMTQAKNWFTDGWKAQIALTPLTK